MNAMQVQSLITGSVSVTRHVLEIPDTCKMADTPKARAYPLI